MQNTIPASNIVSVNPGVIGAGGNSLSLNGVILTSNILLPTNGVMSFGSPTAVSSFFGPNSTEYALSQTYFLGNDNSTIKPTTLFFAPYNAANTNAWLQSGSFAGVSLTTIQGFSGSLSVTVDGYARTAASVNLSGATSFSNAASLIQTALNTGLSSVATSSAGTISGTTLTVGGTISGSFAPGQTITGTGVTANSIILAQLSGTSGGAGTYTLSQSSTVGSAVTITATPTTVAVSWNAVNSTFTITSGASGLASTIAYATGTIAASLALTSATGALLSQGALADTPSSAMNNVIANTQNWGAFMTLFEPTLSNKLAFAAWTNAQNQRYAYIAWDTDANAIVNGATTPFGVVAKAAAYNGVCPVYNTATLAAFVLGMIACIDFSRQNARITSAFKSQSGFVPTVTNAQIAANLLANGYSFYGAYATANQQFNWFYNGQITGQWLWLDTFMNQIYLNSQFQLALMTLLQNVTSIPYNAAGYSLIRAAMKDPIAQALRFGSIRAGVVLSAAEIAEVNMQAGTDVATTIQNQGYYLQVLDPGAQARGTRSTPVINFWYTDGGAVQLINLASIDVI